MIVEINNIEAVSGGVCTPHCQRYIDKICDFDLDGRGGLPYRIRDLDFLINKPYYPFSPESELDLCGCLLGCHVISDFREFDGFIFKFGRNRFLHDV